MTWFAGCVKERYLYMKHQMDHWLHSRIDLYSTLSLVYNERCQTYGKIIEAVYLYANADENEAISQLFDPMSDENPKTILIEGDSGIGKTTLVKEICIKWAEGLVLTSNKLIMLLSLSDPVAHRITTLQQLLEHFTTSSSKAKQICGYLDETQGVGVTIIIDGLDEMKNGLQSRSFFTKLISGKMLLKAAIIFTSRPFTLGYNPSDEMIVNLNEVVYDFVEYQTSRYTDTQDSEIKTHNVSVQWFIESSSPEFLKATTQIKPGSLYLHDNVDRVIEILGFEQSSINHYAYIFFQDSPSKLESLQRHLQQHPHINAMCHNPVVMSMMLFVCMCQPNELPSTTTKLYGSFILYRVTHSLKQFRKLSDDTEISKLEELPNEVIQVLQQLENIAFDGLLSDKLVFTIEELPAVCKDDPSCFGLLNFEQSSCSDTENSGIPNQTFSFLNEGMQEYFAAKYVTNLPNDKVYTLLNESFLVASRLNHRCYDYDNPNSIKVRLSNMWSIYCGILGAQYDNRVPAVMQDFLSIFITNPELNENLYNLDHILPPVSSAQLANLRNTLS